MAGKRTTDWVWILAIFIAGSVSAAPMNPIHVTGWEEDIVIASSDAWQTGSTVALDDESGGAGATVWYEQGYNTSSPTTGLKTGLQQSLNSSDLYFELQSFTGANALFQGGALTLTAATACNRIALIGATGQGVADLTVAFKYTTGADTVFLLSGAINQDWFNGSSVAGYGYGRVSTANGAFEYVGTSNPRLYETIFDVDETRLLQSVEITDVNGLSNSPQQNNFIMAISGEVIPEPTSIALLGVVSGLGLFIRRRFLA